MRILGHQRFHRFPTIGLLAVLAALLFPVSASAQRSKGFAAEEDTKVTGRISIDFKDEPLENVADYISRMVGINVVLAPGVEDRLTLRLVNVQYEQVLNEIANRCNLVVQKEAANLIRLANPPRVTISFQSADIKTAIDMLARQADVNIVVAEGVVGTVNMRLKNIPWRQALESVVKTAGFVTVTDDMGIMRVVTRDSLVEQLETKAFPLKYIQPPSIYIAKIATEFAVGVPEKRKGTPDTLEKEFPLFRALKSVLSEFGRVEFDKDTNAVIVTDIGPKLAEIETIIKQLDVEPLQVFCDVKFVTTTNDDLLDFGARWGTDAAPPGFDLSGLGSFGFLFGAGRGYDTLGPYTYGGGNSFAVAGLPFRTDQGGMLSPVAALRPTGNIGILDFSRMNFAMNFIKSDNKSNVVQAPKLFVLDNQEATIFVGRTLRFAQTTVSTSSVSGSTVSGIEEAEKSPVEVGFQLLIAPHVIRDANQVIMTIIPELEFPAGEGGDYWDTFDDLEHQIRLPQIGSSTVVTRLKLDSGQTAVMGGLITEREEETVSKIPLLGDLPLVGWLFKNKNTEKVKENVIIFITVYVVDKGQETRGINAEDITSQNENRLGKPLFLKDRIRRDMDEELEREIDSRRAYEKQFRGSEFKIYEKK